MVGEPSQVKTNPLRMEKEREGKNWVLDDLVELLWEPIRGSISEVLSFFFSWNNKSFYYQNHFELDFPLLAAQGVLKDRAVPALSLSPCANPLASQSLQAKPSSFPLLTAADSMQNCKYFFNLWGKESEGGNGLCSAVLPRCYRWFLFQHWLQQTHIRGGRCNSLADCHNQLQVYIYCFLTVWLWAN